MLVYSVNGGDPLILPSEQCRFYVTHAVFRAGNGVPYRHDDDGGIYIRRIIQIQKGFHISMGQRFAQPRRHVFQQGGKLTAFGPSGAGFDGVCRSINCESLSGWLSDEPAECDMLPAEARCREIFAVILRTVKGWQCSEWQNKTLSWEEMSKIFTSAMESVPDKFYIIDQQNIRLSQEGLLYWNDIAERIIL